MRQYYDFVVNGKMTTVEALNLFDALVAFCKATNQNAFATHLPFTKLEVSVRTENNHDECTGSTGQV